MTVSTIALFRVFCEAESLGSAQAVAEILEGRLASVGSVTVERIEQYWKIPEWFEIAICVEPKSQEEQVVEECKQALSVSWSTQGGLVMWRQVGETGSDIPSVTWASIELIEA